MVSKYWFSHTVVQKRHVREEKAAELPSRIAAGSGRLFYFSNVVPTPLPRPGQESWPHSVGFKAKLLKIHISPPPPPAYLFQAASSSWVSDKSQESGGILEPELGGVDVSQPASPDIFFWRERSDPAALMREQRCRCRSRLAPGRESEEEGWKVAPSLPASAAGTAFPGAPTLGLLARPGSCDSRRHPRSRRGEKGG